MKVTCVNKSQIAKYLIENKAKAYKNTGDGFVEFRNKENKLIGRIIKGKAPLGQYRYVNIDLYKADSEKLFLSKRIEIETQSKYFLKEHKFMPVKIEIENIIYDFEHNIKNKDVITRGLYSDRYIEQLKESEELKAERQKLGREIPDDYPMYKINKPFNYELKAHLYYRKTAIDSTKPITKE